MPFTAKSSLVLLEFSSTEHSQQSTATLSVGPCVSVRLGRPKFSASEVTCWLYWAAAGFCVCFSHQDFPPFYILCHSFVVTLFLFCFSVLSGCAIPCLVFRKGTEG